MNQNSSSILPELPHHFLSLVVKTLGLWDTDKCSFRYKLTQNTQSPDQREYFKSTVNWYCAHTYCLSVSVKDTKINHAMNNGCIHYDKNIQLKQLNPSTCRSNTQTNKTRRGDLYLKVKQKIKNSLKETASGFLQAIPERWAKNNLSLSSYCSFSIHSQMDSLTSNRYLLPFISLAIFIYIHLLSWFRWFYNEYTLLAGILISKKFNNMLNLGFIFPNSYMPAFFYG